MQKNNKQPQLEITAEMSIACLNARIKVLSKCEGEILKVFDEYKVTTPEAIFMFEKIKFTALYSDALRTASRQAKQQQTQQAGNMFR